MADLVVECQVCGAGMMIVKDDEDDDEKEILICSRWPDCEYTEPLPPAYEMRRHGEQTLPGLE